MQLCLVQSQCHEHQPAIEGPGNFRDLNAAIIRLATLAPAGRITVDQVKAEVAHLKAVWRGGLTTTEPGLVDRVLTSHTAEYLDRFDRVQLEDVLHVCRSSASLSAAGRVLFDRSRERKKIANDADRLRKYLARFDLEWSDVKARLEKHAAPSITAPARR
jgi:transcriptional regulatory protein RtcR